MIADKPVAMAEHEGEADGIEKNAAETCVHNAFHQHVNGFARAAEAGFKHGESDLHSENEKRCDQRPHSVHGIDYVGCFHFRCSGLGVDMSEKQAAYYNH